MRIRTLAIFLLCAFPIAACGGGSSDSAGSDPNRAGALDHLDGVVTMNDEDAFALAPSDGSDELEFRLGPEVDLGAVRALEAAGAPARVSFRPGGDPLVAASVVPAPKLGEGLETVEGTVVSVDADELVIDVGGTERTFDISEAGAGSFDVPHLEDHASENEPIKVYFDPESPGIGLAYEDA